MEYDGAAHNDDFKAYEWYKIRLLSIVFGAWLRWTNHKCYQKTVLRAGFRHYLDLSFQKFRIKLFTFRDRVRKFDRDFIVGSFFHNLVQKQIAIIAWSKFIRASLLKPKNGNFQICLNHYKRTKLFFIKLRNVTLRKRQLHFIKFTCFSERIANAFTALKRQRILRLKNSIRDGLCVKFKKDFMIRKYFGSSFKYYISIKIIIILYLNFISIGLWHSKMEYNKMINNNIHQNHHRKLISFIHFRNHIKDLKLIHIKRRYSNLVYLKLY